MYRQRKRDLNLKPNRQLDKRSSRGMIYENEELRMRTIAICEDVDRGQSDIKKLRKENDYLKREIWGLRDECERLEGVLKKVCISANIPEFELETPSKSKGGDDDDEDGSEDSQDEDEEEDDDDDESYGEEEDEDVPPDKYLKAGGAGTSKNKKKRRASGASVTTFDSEVGSYISNMFGDEKPPEQFQQEEVGFAAEDPGSVILNPEQLTSEPIAGSSGGVVYQPWQVSPHPAHQTHPTAPTDLEILREESEGSLSSGIPAKPIERKGIGFENISDTIPQTDENLMDYLAFPGDDRKTPLIHITPASSPTSNSNETANSVEMEESNNGGGREETSQSGAGLITVVPKTFKVTSEILVGSENKSGEQDEDEVYVPPPMESKSTELSRKQLSPGGSGGICQRRSFYLPTGTLPLHSFSTIPHRAFGIPGHCCCPHLHSHPHHPNNDLLFGGCQSEPSLTSSPQQAMPPTSDGIGPHSSVTSFFNNFCCRGGPAETPLAAASPSMWNTVDKNIVIGFYGYSTASQGKETNLFSNEPSVQEIIDRLEAEFDPTLENILGIRLIPPGRLFISLRNSSVVKSFLNHFKNDLILTSKLNPSQKLRIHFIEGTTTKLTTTLVLSGIPPELPDLSVISVLNQFGQVVAPLERRNYKGIDISERIVKMHLVVREGSLPEFVNVSGYEVRINRAEENETDQTAKLTLGQKQAPTGTSSDYATKTFVHHQRIQPQRKYGFIDPTTVTIPPGEPAAAAAPTPTGPTTTLKPHKPVIRSSSSAPRLETPVPGTLPSSYPLPPIEQKRQSSVCVGNIPSEQHPSKIHLSQTKITQQPTGSAQTSSVPNLQPPPVKKPLARLLVSSPGSLPQSPIGSPGSPFSEKKSEGPLKSLLYKGFDPKASVASSEKRSHGPLTPSSSYSPKTKRKNSGVQFASGNLNKPGKKHREPLPWCGCWGLGCGINEQK